MSTGADIDWKYWRKLPEVKVFEAVALLAGREPGTSPPEENEADITYRKTFRLLIASLANRTFFSPGTLNMGDPALHGVRLLEVGAWAAENGYALPEGFPVAPKPSPGPQAISNFPPPITPLRGVNSTPSRTPLPAKWQIWQFTPKIELWKAVCLTLDIEPDAERHNLTDWFKQRRGTPRGLPEAFVARLQVVQANVSTNGPIHPISLYQGVLTDPCAEVLLSEISALAQRCGWQIPEAMSALESDATGAEKGAAPQVQDTAARPTKSQAHRLKNRAAAILTAEIDKAKENTNRPDDSASVWTELTKLAEFAYGAMIGFSSDGIQYRGSEYQKTQMPDVFTKRNLRERMTREAAKSRV